MVLVRDAQQEPTAQPGAPPASGGLLLLPCLGVQPQPTCAGDPTGAPLGVRWRETPLCSSFPPRRCAQHPIATAQHPTAAAQHSPAPHSLARGARWYVSPLPSRTAGQRGRVLLQEDAAGLHTAAWQQGSAPAAP